MRLVVVVVMTWFVVGCTPVVDSVDTGESSDSGVNMATIISADTIEENINKGDLQKADDQYLDYRNSDESIPELTSVELTLAQAHFDKGEYLLAVFYAKRILRSSTDSEKSGDAAYIMVHSVYKRYEKNPSDEKLGDQFARMAESFRNNYYSNSHREDVDSLLESYKSKKNGRYEELAASYDRQGKPEAAEFYRSKIVD